METNIFSEHKQRDQQIAEAHTEALREGFDNLANALRKVSGQNALMELIRELTDRIANLEGKVAILSTSRVVDSQFDPAQLALPPKPVVDVQQRAREIVAELANDYKEDQFIPKEAWLIALDKDDDTKGKIIKDQWRDLMFWIRENIGEKVHSQTSTIIKGKAFDPDLTPTGGVQQAEPKNPPQQTLKLEQRHTGELDKHSLTSHGINWTAKTKDVNIRPDSDLDMPRIIRALCLCVSSHVDENGEKSILHAGILKEAMLNIDPSFQECKNDWWSKARAVGQDLKIIKFAPNHNSRCGYYLAGPAIAGRKNLYCQTQQ